MTCSVVIATFNGEKYIEEQLNSILCQSRMPDFIVVTDDGSNDATVSICNEVLGKSNIEYKIIKNPKEKGVANNFFSGIDICKQDIIFFSDQDDIWLEKKIEKVMSVFENNPSCKMVLNDAYIWFPGQKGEKERIFERFKIGELFDSNGKYYKNRYCLELLCRNFATGMCMAIHRNISDKKKENLHIFHDTWYNLVGAAVGDIFAIFEPLCLYRQHRYNTQGMNRMNIFRRVRNPIYNNFKSMEKEKEKYQIIEMLQKDYYFLDEENLKLFLEKKYFFEERKKYIENRNIVKLIILLKNNKEKKYYPSILFIIRDIITCFWGRRKLC